MIKEIAVISIFGNNGLENHQKPPKDPTSSKGDPELGECSIWSLRAKNEA